MYTLGSSTTSPPTHRSSFVALMSTASGRVKLCPKKGKHVKIVDPGPSGRGAKDITV